jgi:hypothetical protein
VWFNSYKRRLVHNLPRLTTASRLLAAESKLITKTARKGKEMEEEVTFDYTGTT